MRILLVTCVTFAAAIARGQVPPYAFVNFEARQANPIRLTVDGQRLFAVNSADARLSVFDATQTPPALLAEIPVGIEPVSVNARTNDEVWVVNELSDSVSIVSVARGIVTDTLDVKDEPADVVFAAGRAFVSVAGNNELRVYDEGSHAFITVIPLAGQRPRAMTPNADGSKVFVAFAESGNRTTIVPPAVAPPQPPPTNAALPPPPQVGLIVDAADPKWAPSVIKFTIPDNDVAEIDVASLTVSRYFSRVGTSNLAIAVQPGSGDLFVANTDARNLVQFEPNLRGHAVDHRLTRIPIGGGAFTISDLNPNVDYSQFPNPAAQATALAHPSAIVFEPGGNYSYVAAFSSDRVAKISADGAVLARIRIGGDTADPRQMRGPRGLALDAERGKLYVLNRIANSVSVVDTKSERVISEVPIGAYDPTPQVIRNGRGFLYDARLSGNGTMSCASCHLDGNNDRLAWDLGDPGGAMQTVKGIASSAHQRIESEAHPMKGPMTTQTLKGLRDGQPLHWRADHDRFAAFNHAFESLLGGHELASSDMEAFRGFVETLTFPPNPNQQRNRTLPRAVAGGDPAARLNTFVNEQYAPGLTCNSCHFATPGRGTDETITSGVLLQQSQDFKVPHLRATYQKTSFNDTPGAISLDGFGQTHDGIEASVASLLSRPVFPLIRFDEVRKRNLNAFLMCFDTGIAPAVGFTRTMSSANVNDPAALIDWTLLEAQAATGNLDLIAKGTIDGHPHGLLYRPSSADYQTDQDGLGPFTHDELQAKLGGGDTLNVMGVPIGSGVRMGVDRDLDGELDRGGRSTLPRMAASQSLANISTRLRIGAGDNALIGGFIVTGPGSKKVIVRAIGPSLPTADAIADPTLELYRPDGTVLQNDNWRDNQEHEVIASGIPPASTNESAIVATLEPGAYTAVVRGKDAAAGLALVEVYDLDQSTPAKLANISARGYVGAGDDVIIAGYVVGGDHAAKVVVRALGPSLRIENALQDPVLEVHDANGNVTVNNNWRDDQERDVLASGLAPASDLESAIEQLQVPGPYTAIVRGNGGSTGLALIEAYQLRD